MNGSLYWSWVPAGLLGAAALAACGGGNQRAETGAPAALPGTLQHGIGALKRLPAIVTYPGAVIGVPGMFEPPSGDGAGGGQGGPVDKIGCYAKEIVNEYHIHVFLGVVYDKVMMALPTQIGMIDPGSPDNGFTSKAKCFYRIHTHDSSGIVHLEFKSKRPLGAAFVTLKDFLDIWGVGHGSSGFGPFSGAVHVFYGKESTLGQVTIGSYKKYAGQLAKIVLHSHDVVWVEVGDSYYSAAELPPVQFYMEY